MRARALLSHPRLYPHPQPPSSMRWLSIQPASARKSPAACTQQPARSQQRQPPPPRRHGKIRRYDDSTRDGIFRRAKRFPSLLSVRACRRLHLFSHLSEVVAVGDILEGHRRDEANRLPSRAARRRSLLTPAYNGSAQPHEKRDKRALPQVNALAPPSPAGKWVSDLRGRIAGLRNPSHDEGSIMCCGLIRTEGSPSKGSASNGRTRAYDPSRHSRR